MANDIAERLDADQARMLRAGELVTHLEYQCWQYGHARYR